MWLEFVPKKFCRLLGAKSSNSKKNIRSKILFLSPDFLAFNVLKADWVSTPEINSPILIVNQKIEKFAPAEYDDMLYKHGYALCNQ